MFVRVDADRAGPTALGVLIPPGKQTLIVVRPKPLPWDLLAARWDGDATRAPVFCQFTREEAPGVARNLVQFLRDAVTKGTDPLQSFGKPHCCQIWLRTPEYVWIVCNRTPGEGYRPVSFASLEDAHAAGEKLAQYLWPRQSQEVYFNTQLFS